MGISGSRVWRIRGRELPLGNRTLIMGVLNVTPDSFSDGGNYSNPTVAIGHAIRLQDEGADLIDIGAESTRPGSGPVPGSQQLERLLPVIDNLIGKVSVPLSVDTTNSSVVDAVLQAGVSVINDVSGLQADPELADICAHFGAGLVLMHMRGTPATMQQQTHYENLIADVRAGLESSVYQALHRGVGRENCLVDPGIGFGKTFEQNHELIAGMHRFAGVGAGILAGPSRKGFTGELSRLPPGKRQFATASAVTMCVLSGADVVRVHDVREMREVVDFADRHRGIVAKGER